MKITDEELVKGCIAGKEKSRRLLYDRFSGKMLAICFRYLKDRMEAEDVMIQGFIKVFARLDSFKGGILESWLRSIFIRLSIDRWRVVKNQVWFRAEELTNELQEVESVPFDQFTNEEIIATIETLPEGCQVVFKLNAIEGYNHKEIGEMLGIDSGTSRSQLNRARKILQSKLMGFVL